MMNYGAPGVGKTDFLASCGSGLGLITDLNGIVTLQNDRIKKLYPGFDPTVEVIDSSDDVTQPKAFYAIQAAAERLLLNPEITIIGVDDSSFMRRSASHLAVMLNYEDAQKSLTFEKVKKNKGNLAPTQADMGREMSIVEQFLDELTRNARSMKKHVVVNAHERYIYKKDRDTKTEVISKIVPHFTGRSAPESLLGYFDLVFRLTMEGGPPNNYVTFQGSPDKKVAAKDRYGIVKGPQERNLTWSEIYNRIQKVDNK